MKKLLLFTILTISLGLNAQVVIYSTTNVGTSGVEVSNATNGPATKMGDAVVLAGTQRFLNSIVAKMFALTDVTPFTVTMSLYTDCPSVTGSGACGSGAGTLIPGSTVTVAVTPPAASGTQVDVTFPYSSLNLSSETDNTITVMINASRTNVFWTIGETPVVGAMPAGETGFGFATRCGSVGTNNGCARNFGIDNNFSMTINASATLKTDNFVSSKFSISPNPTNDFVNISNSDNIKVSSVKITDLNGRVVKQSNFDSVSDIKMNVSDLSSGIYMMNINSNEGSVTKKIIKN